MMKRAFGVLKFRWRILLKRNERKLKSIAMHNFCLKLQDFYEPEEKIDNDPEVNIPPENELYDEGQDIRNAICDYLVEQRVI